MNNKLQDSSHRLGITFATLVVLVGMAIAVTDMMEGGSQQRTAMLETAAYTLGIALVCYVVVRLVGWAFAEAMLTTREQQARK